MHTNNLWQLRSQDILYAASGAALYAVLTWVSGSIQLPGSILGWIRLPIVIPIIIGILVGPLAGFLTGAAGSILSYMLTGFGFSLNWAIGYGLIGLLPGLLPYIGVLEIKTLRDYSLVSVAAIAACLVGVTFAVLVDVVVWRIIGFGIALTGELAPIGGLYALNAAILTPLLLFAWAKYRVRARP